MKNLLLILSLLLITSNVYAQLQIAGTTPSNDGNKKILFFDDKTLKKKNGVVNFWIKSYSRNDIFKELDKDREFYLLKATEKLGSYTPKMLLVDGIKDAYDLKTNEQKSVLMLDIILNELAVNTGNVHFFLQTHWELDCKKNTTKIIEVGMFNTELQKSKEPAFSIDPDSNSNSWKQMFCNN